MDLRVAAIEGRIDGIHARIDACMGVLAERDRRIELLAASAADSAKEARSLKSNMWFAGLSVMITVVATTVASYFASQQSSIAIVQAVQSVYQQGQHSAASAGRAGS